MTFSPENPRSNLLAVIFFFCYEQTALTTGLLKFGKAARSLVAIKNGVGICAAFG